MFEFITIVTVVTLIALFATQTKLGKTLVANLNFLGQKNADKMIKPVEKMKVQLNTMNANVTKSKAGLASVAGDFTVESNKLDELKKEEKELDDDVKLAIQGKFSDTLVNSRVAKLDAKQKEIAAQQAIVDTLSSTVDVTKQAVNDSQEKLEDKTREFKADANKARAAETLKVAAETTQVAHDADKGLTEFGAAHDDIQREFATQQAALDIAQGPKEDREFEQAKKQDRIAKLRAEKEAQYNQQQQ